MNVEEGKNMKVALISDIHANEPALDAVLQDMEKHAVDTVICLGDVATLGPSPREVLHKLRKLNCLCLIGNHEEALFHPEDALSFDIKQNLFSTLDWCNERLDEDDMTFLRGSLPTALHKVANNQSMFCYHGSPRSSTEGIYPETPHEKLDELFLNLDETVRVVAGGHTHVQMYKQHRHFVIINPGSVGCAFVSPQEPKAPPKYLPYAEYAIVTFDEGSISVDLRRLKFDVSCFAATVLESTLPLKDWWAGEFDRLGVVPR